jgi:hypothetical protein
MFTSAVTRTAASTAVTLIGSRIVPFLAWNVVRFGRTIVGAGLAAPASGNGATEDGAGVSAAGVETVVAGDTGLGAGTGPTIAVKPDPVTATAAEADVAGTAGAGTAEAVGDTIDDGTVDCVGAMAAEWSDPDPTDAGSDTGAGAESTGVGLAGDVGGAVSNGALGGVGTLEATVDATASGAVGAVGAVGGVVAPTLTCTAAGSRAATLTLNKPEPSTLIVGVCR